MAKNLDFNRHISFEENYSFFLFGARGTGKTTLLEKFFKNKAKFLDLLNPELESRFKRNPNILIEIVNSLTDDEKYIVIDEVQKVPELLDIVHGLIERTPKLFILTVSSARKLKRGNANLLAGRAFTYKLYPFTSFELVDNFNLSHALHWGLIPKVQEFETDKAKEKFLIAYAQTYLKEEIFAEQFVRALDPFRHFLELAAQMNGKILNFTKLSRDIGIDDKTIKKYYSILEDTLLGFSLKAFKHSFRKQLQTKAKFYLFDTGVKRSLDNTLSIPLKEGSSAYGEAFEHFIILEIIKLSSYFHEDYRFSYLKTKDDAEVDLIVERPGQPYLFIEIKSSKEVQESHLTNLIRLSNDFGDCVPICLSQDSIKRKISNVEVYPWQEGIKQMLNLCNSV
ncbi:MAG: AAA family ATPase [Cyanobacteria bacterium]|nr:AAA family ATPase [Cyanobacteriota bacterium]